MSGLVTARDVARRLNVPLPRVYELVRAGTLPHIRLGRQVRFDAERLERWLARGGTDDVAGSAESPYDPAPSRVLPDADAGV